MRTALRRTAEAVLSSAVTVIVGTCSPCCSPSSPPPGGSASPARWASQSAAFYALVVLPTVLVLFGRWVFWPLVPRVGQPPLVESDHSVWRRVGDTVGPPPRGTFIVVTTLVLAAMALGVTQIQTGLPSPTSSSTSPRRSRPPSASPSRSPPGRRTPPSCSPVADGESVAATARQRSGRRSSATLSGDGLAQIDVVIEGEPAATGEGHGRWTCATPWRSTTRPGSAAARRRPSTRTDAVGAGPAGDHPADPAPGPAGAGAPAAIGRGTPDPGEHRRGDVPGQPRTLLVDLHRRARHGAARRRRPAAGVPLPGRARRGLQHLPGQPGLPRRQARTAPGPACCAR